MHTDLIEDRTDSTEEGPLSELSYSLAVFVGHAHVEDLAVVVCVGIVTELAAGTTTNKRVRNIRQLYTHCECA